MDLTQGNIRKQLISMAVPAGIGMLFYTLYNVVDTFYAGLISTEALAGLAISFPVYFILLAFAVGFGQGTTALVSNLLGAKKEEDALPIFLEELKKYDCNILIVASEDQHEYDKIIKNYQNIKIISQKNKL